MINIWWRFFSPDLAKVNLLHLCAMNIGTVMDSLDSDPTNRFWNGPSSKKKTMVTVDEQLPTCITTRLLFPVPKRLGI